MTPRGVYRHYKGDLYAVISTFPDSTNARNGEPVVLYCSLKLNRLRVRTEAEFNELVRWPDGSTRPRFERIGSVDSHLWPRRFGALE